MADGEYWLLKAASDPRASMMSMKLRVDSNIFLYKYEEQSVVLDEVYRVNKNRPLIIKPAGVWSKMSGLLLTSVPFWERRKDLQGITLIGGCMDVSEH